MRDILFKGKRLGNDEWIEGFLHMNKTKSKCKIVTILTNTRFVYYETKPDTICQYTGLVDKNNNKIWENDIVKCYADTDDLGNDLYFYYRVIWHENYHCWWLSDIHTVEDEYLHQYNSSDIEIIGNIFDNPKLIQEEK